MRTGWLNPAEGRGPQTLSCGVELEGTFAREVRKLGADFAFSWPKTEMICPVTSGRGLINQDHKFILILIVMGSHRGLPREISFRIKFSEASAKKTLEPPLDSLAL